MVHGPRIVIPILTWNLFHGRDHPPDPDLLTWRSRLLGLSETNATHVQVNRSLRDEFAATLAGFDWHVALLQEAPPWWLEPLALRAGAQSAASALTSRNWAAPLRRFAAERRPDLGRLGEAGSNQLLVRPPWRIAEVRRLTLTRRPERRRMIWARLSGPDGMSLAVANVHLSAWDSPAAGREVRFAAEHATAWAGADPLVFGGDLNAADELDELYKRLALTPRPASVETTIDHLAARGLDVLEPPDPLPPDRREAPASGGRRVRLSDHSPLLARFAEPR